MTLAQVMKYSTLLFIQCLAVCASSAELVVYNWDQFLSEELIAEFETRTGHSIRMVYYEDEGVRDREFLLADPGKYDLVLFDEHSLRVFESGNHFRNISELNITGAENHTPVSREICGSHGAPYAWGTSGIAYRSSFFENPITSWNSLFSPPVDLPTGIVMPLDEVDTVTAALQGLGYASTSKNPAHMNQIYELLKAQMPKVLGYRAAYSHARHFGEQSDMVLALTYSTDFWGIVDETGQDDWRFVIPDEGSTLWFNCWVIPVSAKLPDVAIELLEFLNEPKAAAKNADQIWYATTNARALTLMSERYRQDPVLFPGEAIMERLSLVPAMNAESIKLRNSLMFTIRALWNRQQRAEGAE